MNDKDVHKKKQEDGFCIRKSLFSDAKEIILAEADAFREEVNFYRHGPSESDS